MASEFTSGFNPDTSTKSPEATGDSTPPFEVRERTVADLEEELAATRSERDQAVRRAKAAEAREEELKRKFARDRDLPVVYAKAEMQERVEQRIKIGEAFGIYFIDLDKFKRVNDLISHERADEVIAALAQSLNDRFRRDSDIGRFGGDEFLIISIGLNTLDNQWPDEAEQRSTDIGTQMSNGHVRLREAESEILKKFPDAAALGIGLSIGSVVFNPEQPLDAKALIKEAEQAMYQDKRARKRKALRRDLVKALKKLITFGIK